MSEEKFSGVEALLERMKTHPEEFFEVGDKRSRWSFIYKDYFKDCLSEAERGRLHDGLRTIRRMEFEATIVKELLKDEMHESQPGPEPGQTRDAKRVLMNPTQVAVAKQLANTNTPSANLIKARLHQGLMQAQSDDVLGKKP
jgi:hypothetical protein